LGFSHTETEIATRLPPEMSRLFSFRAYPHSVRTLAKAASKISAARASVFLNMCP